MLMVDAMELRLQLFDPFVFLAEFILKLHLMRLDFLLHQLTLLGHLLHYSLVYVFFFLKEVLLEGIQRIDLIQELLIFGA